MGRRRDESCYFVDGVRTLPTLQVVAAWDDGFFIHCLLHVIAGEDEGFLGYCYEDDPSRWSRQVSDVAAQEVSLLSDQWFYGENLVPKIAGVEPGQIRWQYPVPDTPLPMSMGNCGPGIWGGGVEKSRVFPRSTEPTIKRLAGASCGQAQRAGIPSHYDR